MGLAQGSILAYHRDVMSNPKDQLLDLLRAGFALAERTGSRLKALSSLLEWFQLRSGAQRAILVSTNDEGSYRVWCSRDGDGRKVQKASDSISLHAFQLGCNKKEPTFFPDVHLDRRFRAASETKGVNRSRWILVIPVSVAGDTTVLYLDSKFGLFDSSILEDADVGIARTCIELIVDFEMNREGLPVVEPSSSTKKTTVEETEPAIEMVLDRAESRIGDFVTHSTALADTIAELKKIAPTKIPVLIEGESGTGKEMLAKAIHQQSGFEGPLIALHCGSITESLIEIELFGYEKGAFTDAESEKPGLIELAAGGTLLLDAIDESSQALQLSLLRFLESGTYRRVAGESERTADVRVIACTSSSENETDVRNDLHFRLAGFQVWLPPLRERPIDALWIIEKGLSAGEKEAPILEAQAQALILAHSWPGNGWEASHLAQRVLASGCSTVEGSLVFELLGHQDGGEELVTDPGVREVLGVAEREVILRALKAANGNKSVACHALGISRRTLYRRMQKYGIPLTDSDRSGD